MMSKFVSYCVNETCIQIPYTHNAQIFLDNVSSVCPSRVEIVTKTSLATSICIIIILILLTVWYLHWQKYKKQAGGVSR